MTDNKSGFGLFGFHVVGGVGSEFQINQNRVIQGCMVQASTSTSSQLTGSGNGTYLYDMQAGLIACGGKVLEVAAVADAACEAIGDIMVDTFAKHYTMVAYKSNEDSAVRTRLFTGTAVLAEDAVPVTDAVIEASFATGTFWFRLWTYVIDRTGATTVTEAVDNTVRPTKIPAVVQV